MRHQRSAILRLSALSIILGCMTAGGLLARAELPLPPEEITLPPGAVFEILAQTAEPGTQYAWTLSLDRTFLQAERGRSFRTRFSKQGRYLLSTEVLRPGGIGIRKVFLINVRTDAAAIPPPQTSIESDPPPSSQGVIMLPEGRSVIRLSASAEHMNAIALDANTDTDEDQDGDATNDPSASGTFFTTDVVPLWLWCTDTLPSTIGITTAGKDGAPTQQRFFVTREGLGTVMQKKAVTQGDIHVEDRGNGVVRLEFDAQSIGIGVVPLALWDFGDGEQSMISNPIHRYASSGSFIVRLQITDLRNGTVMKNISQPVTIVVEKNERASPVAPNPETEQAPTRNEGKSPGSMLPLIYRIVGVAIAAVAFGAMITALVVLLRKKRKGLQQHLEDADKKMAIGKESVKENIVEGTVAPLALEEATESTGQSTPPPASPPEEILGPAPAWLNPNPSPVMGATTVQSAPKKPVPPVPVVQNPPPAVTAAPASPKQTPAAAEASSAPAYIPIPPPVTLQAPIAPAPKAPAQPTALKTPAQNNVPVVLEAPAPMSAANTITEEKAPRETEESISDNGDLPAWLQPQPAASSPSPAPIPLPTPFSAEMAKTVPVQTQAMQVPQPDAMQTEKPAASTQTQISDKERERRRLKRQRYRANVRRREEEKGAQQPSPQAISDTAVTSDAPIAIVRAEHITQQNNTPTLPPSESASSTEKNS